MMTALVPSGAPRLPELEKLSTTELRDELSRTLALTAGHLVRLATIVAELERRGEDLSDLRLGLLSYLRRIAHGQVSPELVARFQGAPLALQRAAALPLPDQRRIARGEPLALVVREGEGWTHRLVDPLTLGREDLVQIIAPDHIRTEQEQILLLEHRARHPEKRVVVARGRVYGDRERGGIVMGKRFVPTAEVIRALAEARPPEEPDDTPRTQMGIHVTEDQHKRLKRAAIDRSTNVSDLIRDALRVAGLI